MDTGITDLTPDQWYLIEKVCGPSAKSGLTFHSRDLAEQFCREAIAVLFPRFSDPEGSLDANVAERCRQLGELLWEAVTPYALAPAPSPGGVRDAFFGKAPGVYDALCEDAQAMFDGDPAAESLEEVILAYPGFRAIATYRIARVFYELGLHLFPRLLTEYAHRETGIDIHPGAKIGRALAIDHGTGIVIGETAELGDRVRLYQGVTLGAINVSKELAKSKRHPTVGNDVVIYSHATILGGETVIGDGCVIGGNVFLTKSVPPHSVVSRSGTVETRRIEADEAVDFSI